MYGVVGVIPSVPVTKPNRALKLQCSSDGRRIVYGTPMGVVVRMLPEAFDPDYDFPVVKILTGNKKPVSAAAISPDDSMVAGGDLDGNIYVWTETKSGETTLKTYNLDMPYVRIMDIKFSLDSTKMAFCGWDRYGKKLAAVVIVDGAMPMGKVEGHTIGVNGITFRPQKPHRIVTAGADGKLVFHDGPPFKKMLTEEVTVVSADESSGLPLYGANYNNDGDSLVSYGADGILRFWHPVNGGLDKEISLGSAPLLGGSWNKDGSVFACVSNDCVLRLVDCHANEVLCEVKVPTTGTSQTIGVCWTPDTDWIVVMSNGGQIVGFEWDNEAKDLKAKTPTFAWFGSVGTPGILDIYHPKARMMCGTSLGNLLILTQESEPVPLYNLELSTTKDALVKCITQYDTGFLAAASDGKLYEGSLIPAGSEERTEESTIRTMVESFSMAVGGEMKLDDADLKIEIVGSYTCPEAPSVMFPLGAERQTALVITTTGKLVCFPLNMPHTSLEPVWQDMIAASYVWDAAVSTDGCLVAIALEACDEYPLDRFDDERTELTQKQLIEIYEVDDPMTRQGLRFVSVFDWHSSPVTALAISGDGCLLASVDGAKSIIVTDIAQKVCLIPKGKWTSHKTKIVAMDWSNDGTKLVSGSQDGQMCVWDVTDPVKCVKINVHQGSIHDVKFILNNLVMSTGSDGTVVVTEIWF